MAKAFKNHNLHDVVNGKISEVADLSAFTVLQMLLAKTMIMEHGNVWLINQFKHFDIH